MARETLLTEDGLRKLKEELEDLTTRGRAEVAERIKLARGYGDISENAEYDDAKNEQARLEARIMQLEERLRTALVVDEVESNIVGVGSVVNVVDEKSKAKEKYVIVGVTEADPLENRISYESPVGAALMGQKRGAIVQIVLPNGKKIKYKVTSVKPEK